MLPERKVELVLLEHFGVHLEVIPKKHQTLRPAVINSATLII